MQHCQLLWGGGNHTHRLHSKNHFMLRLSAELFFLISTPGRLGWVSADCQTHLHLPNSEEGRGSRAKGESDHPLSAGKCAGKDCQQARLGNARGPGDIFIRKEEENPGKQSQKEGGKVCKNESGLIARSFTQSYPTSNQAFVVTK